MQGPRALQAITPMADKLILVARVAGAFGVKGEVRISTYTENPLAVLNYRSLLREDGQPALTLLSGRSFKGGVIARAKEIDTKEQADRLRGLKLFIERAALPPPDEDEFYLADLIGVQAVAPDGAALGTVKALQDFGAGDLLEIDPGPGRPSWYLPFTRECVPDIDLAAGRLTAVRPPETADRDHRGPKS
jgi:16S rRNA processing protein RimM